MVSLRIDGVTVEAKEGTTILEAARAAGIDIPHLCYHPDLRPQGVCRVCVVEVEGAKTLVASCVQPVGPGMVVRTNTPAVREARRTVVELLLSDHPADCLQCVRNRTCELQGLAQTLGVREQPFGVHEREMRLDESTPAIIRDPNKCILCRRCVQVCDTVQSVRAINVAQRGMSTLVSPAGGALADSPCVMCGQCILACPVGAITERDDTDLVWEKLSDPRVHTVVQTAPAIRASLGELLGLPAGTLVTGKLTAALRRLGFDRVFDTNFTADLTIIEEGHELIHRLKNGGVLPMITSCSPGWIKFIEHQYPEELDHLSTCKSPQQMFGALAKTYYAEKSGVNPADIFVVSIMPCTAKKFEAARPEMKSSGFRDVDVVLTTRELAKMIRQAGIRFEDLPEEGYDSLLGASTGAAALFGTTGGVMEAALRTVYEVVTGKTLEQVEFTPVRGMETVKEMTVDLAGTPVKVAVAHGLANARLIMDKVASGNADYQFIEVMCCPGGCIGGGGQPHPTDMNLRGVRQSGIYAEDRRLPIRKSHENPEIKQIYNDFLREPLGHKSHELLHTHYTPRPLWVSAGSSERVAASRTSAVAGGGTAAGAGAGK